MLARSGAFLCDSPDIYSHVIVKVVVRGNNADTVFVLKTNTVIVQAVEVFSQW